MGKMCIRDRSVCAAAIWEFEDYTSGTKGVKRLANKVVPGEKRCLYLSLIHI